ncbi:hypothetical protein LTR08_001710 [Meristemomyces frigidus]|nr:hypothetical protein LTR08_001710 [Meristemomyces frigidus]
MSRARVKIESAPTRSQWTLAPSDTTLFEVKEEPTMLQANSSPYSDPHERSLRYESYDGSQYSAHSGLDRTSSAGGYTGGMNGGNYNSYDYNTPMDESGGRQISLDTHVRPPEQDEVGQHLLYETAMFDAQAYETLDIAEVDELKKEHARLTTQIEATNRKLLLESKVKDAARNLQRLYSVSSKTRPDTPQSPDSPKKSRSSLLGNRGRTSSGASVVPQTLDRADDELALSIKKVDELNETIKKLLDRRQIVEQKLMRHTAAVLAEQASSARQKISGTALTHGNRVENHDEDTASSIYSPDEFDGIRDILQGKHASAGGKVQRASSLHRLQGEHEQQMASVQDRLEHLNSQLRHVIGEASRIRGMEPEPEPDLEDHENDVNLRLDSRFSRLASNMQILEQEQESVRTHNAHMQDSAFTTRNAVEEQLEGLNRQVHNTLLLGSDMQDMESLREPPQTTGHGYQQQLQYLGDSFLSMEELLQQHRAELDKAREASGGVSRAIEDAHTKASSHAQKVSEYDATLGGLWEILQSDLTSRRPSNIDRDLEEDGLPSPRTPLRDDFSLQAFSAHVQHLFDRAQSAKEQQDILRRQIQQQRDLNGKSDAEKDKQLTDLQGQHEQLNVEHVAVREELARIMAGHAQAESEAGSARSELMNVTNEFDALKRTVEGKQLERDEMARQLETHQTHATSLQEQVEGLEARVSGLTDHARLFAEETEMKHEESAAKHDDLAAQLASAATAREAAEQRHADVQKDMESLEPEVVRLTTELTMAKAELEGAYGSRAERAREGQAAEVVGLHERNQQLSAELSQLRDDHVGLRGVHDNLASEHEGLRGLHEQLGIEHEILRGTHDTTLSSLESARSQEVDVDRTKLLEQELEEMAGEFQEMTRESIQLEKERGQLEDLIDGLRDRCEALEAQLADEKVRWLGIKSPSGLPEQSGGRESTSTMVLRQEFKRMMRETRAEGLKLLRAEQDHRRELETELRRLRQSNGPLAVGPNGIGSA